MPEILNVKLTKVHLKGFKSIDDLTVDFSGGLNILIGKNGAGKSNFLEFVSDAIDYHALGKTFRYAKCFYTAEDGSKIAVEYEREVIKGDLLKGSTSKDRYFMSHRLTLNDKVVFDSRVEDETANVFRGKKLRVRMSVLSKFRTMGYDFPLSTYITFNLPKNLECIEQPGMINIDLDEESLIWGTISTLTYLDDLVFSAEYSIDYDEGAEFLGITKEKIIAALTMSDEMLYALQRYSPISDVRINSNLNIYRIEDRIVIENIKVDFLINDVWMPWSQLSDGSKRLFYVITEVMSIPGGIVLLEEPELGIHPHQFNLLMDFIKEQSLQTQIILSTHSPKSLDHLDMDELDKILIASYDRNLGTQIRHLSRREKGKAQEYIEQVGFLSDYWLMSDLEE